MKNRIVLVTGSGRGIGLAVAERFLSRGARVVVTARTEAEIDQAVLQFENKYGPGRAIGIYSDVSKISSIQSLFDEIEKTWGPVEVLINNAALGFVTDFLTVTPETFDEIQGVNVRGLFFCSQEMMARLARKKLPGVIVNLSSLGGLQGTEKFKGLAPYVASKFAVIGITEALAVEGKELGIRVNCVAPGAVDTEMLRRAAPHLKTNTQPVDVARVIVDLVEEAYSHGTTGKIVEIHSNI